MLPTEKKTLLFKIHVHKCVWDMKLGNSYATKFRSSTTTTTKKRKSTIK